MDKLSRVHVVSFDNLIGTTRARQQKLTTFPADVARLSPPPPPFLRREPGDEGTVRKPSLGGIIATSANQIVSSSYKNVHQTPLSSWRVEGGSGYETNSAQERKGLTVTRPFS